MQYRMYLVVRRLKFNYSLTRVAKDAGITRQHYMRIETGKNTFRLSFKTMCSIAKALAIPLDTMYEEEMKYLDDINRLKEAR